MSDVSYFHTNIIPYFLHSLGCPLHFIAPALVAATLVIWRTRRRTGGQISRLSFTLLSSSLTLLAWMTDLPVVFGRCPGGQPTVVFAPYDPLGLIIGITAGLVTFVSPCGLPVLPAFMRFFLGAKSSGERGLSLGLLATSGFVFAIVAVGLLFYVLSDLFLRVFKAVLPSLYYYIPASVFEILGYLAGVLSLGMGGLMIFHVRIPFFKSPTVNAHKRSVSSVFFFSLGWGGATITCSPYALFPLLLYALASGGLGPFVGYALGMALPVILVSLFLSLGRGGLVDKIARFKEFNKLGGIILLIMGAYIIYYTYSRPATAGLYKFGNEFKQP